MNLTQYNAMPEGDTKLAFRCAKVCEEFKHEIEHYDVTANDCANAIRARSKA